MGNLGNLDKIDAGYDDIRFIYERYIELRKWKIQIAIFQKKEKI